MSKTRSAALVEQFRALTLFADSPDAARAARGMARSTFQDWGLQGLVDDAQLVVSELVSNAIHHTTPDECYVVPGASRRIDVGFRRWPKWLFIEVSDEDSSPPMIPIGEVFSPALVGDLPEALLPDSGRGLRIVQRLVDDLWWAPGEMGGKTVVCRFDLGPARLGGSPNERGC
ncbi:ATP-binding protein [Streptomyces sp. NRRL B-1677]|uniref:ATP-binding protein n=1 Tax=Streptomyces sp. NRRL B-1677 TaxID=2682966 RepID=UPI001E63690A|nr:ATP-binding protein [Streptomyces sp. NRRL B-1677]